MTLFELRDYCKRFRIVNLTSASLHFREDPQLIKQKLQHWQRKGYVRQLACVQCCQQSCQQCQVLQAETYEWFDAST